MQPHAVHEIVHDEGGTRHIPAILHEGDEEVEDQDIGQEDDNRTHTTYNAVGKQRLQGALVKVRGGQLAKPPKEALNPIHRILPQSKGAPEGDKHEEQEDGITQPTVGDKGVDMVGEDMQVTLLIAVITLRQGTMHEGILGIGDGGLDIMAVATQKVVGNLAAHSTHTTIGVAVGNITFQLTVALQQLDSQETSGKGIREAMLDEVAAQAIYTALKFTTMVHMNMTECFLTILGSSTLRALEDLYNFIEETVDTHTGTTRSRHHRDTKQGGKLVKVKAVTAALQLVIHIEGHHHGDIHIDKLRCEVEVALQVGGVDDIENDIRVLVKDMTAHIELLRRIGTERIGAGEVDEVDGITGMMEGAHLLVNGDAAIVAHTLMSVGGDIEDGGLATVGVTDKGHMDALATLTRHMLQRGLTDTGNGTIVVMVHNLGLSFSLTDNLHLGGISTAQRHLEVHDTVFDRVVKRSIEDRLNSDTLDESHLYNTLTESTMARHTHHHGTHTRL